MGLFGWFKKDARANHSFDEKDRELALERRRQNIELENLKRQNALDEERIRHEIKMAELQAELDEFADDEPPYDAMPQGYAGMAPEDAVAMRLIDRAFEARGNPVKQAATAASPAAPAAKRYTDAELSELWQRVPDTVKAMAPRCTDAQVCEFIKARMMPDADEDTMQRALKLARQLAAS